MQRLLDAAIPFCWRPAASVRWSECPAQVIKIVDVKCPHSGEPDTFHIENLDCLNSRG